MKVLITGGCGFIGGHLLRAAFVLRLPVQREGVGEEESR